MKSAKSFWNKEYSKPQHLALSLEPSGDLLDFVAWFEKEYGDGILKHTTVLDVGCGNGRNSGYLARTYKTKGIGFDLSSVAIQEAKKGEQKGLIEYMVRDIREPLPVPDESVGLVLDLMASHVLNKEEREVYLKELIRVLEPKGVVMWKSLLKEGDIHSKRLLAEHSVKGEENAYIHPTFKFLEHVWGEDEFVEFVAPYFDIALFKRSHGHKKRNVNARKRRYFVAYLIKRSL